MKNTIIKSRILFLLAIVLTGLQAQEVLITKGGNIFGNGGSVSFSIGQVIYTTNTGTNYYVAQGIQQPFDIIIISGLEKTEGITLLCTAYPNPTTDLVKLNVENYKTENLIYQLFDNYGNLLEIKKYEGNEAIILMRNLVPAIYFLKVIEGNKEIKTFKIVKK